MPADTTKRDCEHERFRHQHGTYGAFRQDRCRCFPCRLAGNDRKHTGDQVFVPAVGMERRLQALAAIGWGSSRIAAMVGVSSKRVEQWRDGKYDQVHPSTVDRVREVYDELWDRTPPQDSKGDRISVERSKRHAQRRGWLPPLAWDDDAIDQPGVPTGDLGDDADELDAVAVERAMQGDAACATRAELDEAARVLTERGYSAAQIADRLGVSDRTIQRKRAAA